MSSLSLEIKVLPVADLVPDPRLERVMMIPDLAARELERSRSKDVGDKRKVYEKRARQQSCDFESLTESIKNNGQREAIKVWKSGGQWLVVDGRHRWLAAKEIGLTHVKCVEVPEDDVVSIALDADTRRHLSKGALAYRAVLLNPEVASGGAEREKSGVKLEPSAMNAEGLARRISVGSRTMETACRLYLIFEGHPELQKRYEASVWTCSSIAKLCGEMAKRVEWKNDLLTYFPKPDEPTEAEQQQQAEELARELAKLAFYQRCEKAAEIGEQWPSLKDEDKKEIQVSIADEVSALPVECLTVYARAIKERLAQEGTQYE